MFYPCAPYDITLDDGETVRLAVIHDGLQDHVLLGVESVSRTVTITELTDAICSYLRLYYNKEEAVAIQAALADRIRNFS